MIKAIRAFSDNYIWAIGIEDRYVIVDPGEAAPVIDFLGDSKLEAILITHLHNDHIGGVNELKEKYGSKVYGPIETSELNDVTVGHGDEFEILNKKFQVILTAGHTKEHISYLMEDNLFCDDALFLAGCGRVFTKDYKLAYDGLQRLKKLDDNTKVYAAHEYSLSNLKFAKTIIDNEELNNEYEKVKKLREKDEITLPSTMGLEKKINPFLLADCVEEFKNFRDKKDNA